MELTGIFLIVMQGGHRMKKNFKIILAGIAACFILILTSKFPVEAATYRDKYISDSNSAVYGKTIRLYYDNLGNIIEDTTGIAGSFSSYDIYINKSQNIVTVYGINGNVYVPVKRFVCSNGGSNTPEGVFYTPNKYRWWTLMGPSYGQWCTRIHGGVLFHSVYYNSYNNPQSLSVNAYNKLGTTCSHGCVRLTAGDAKWIYDNCPTGTKVVVYSGWGYEPFSKPVADKLPSWHTWDPTDPTSRYLCDQHGCHSAAYEGLAYDSVSQQWKYYKGGRFADWFTSIVCKDGKWYYVKNGIVDFSATTVAHNENGWWYVRNGVVDFSANTIACNSNGWWYIRGGKVDFGFNGIARNENGDWYIRGGKVQFGTNEVVHTNHVEQTYPNTSGQRISFEGWYNVRGGKVRYNQETVAHNGNGWWYIGKDGKVNFHYYGIASNENGTWYLENGKVSFHYNGFLNWGDKTYYLRGSRIQTEMKDVIHVNNAWYYIKNGVLWNGGETVAHNGNGWWYIGTDGKVNFHYNGIASNENGTWYLENGKVSFHYNGFLTLGDTTYYVKGSRIQTEINDVVNIGRGWYYIKNGVLQDKSVTVQCNRNGWWYIGTDGKVNFHYNGIASNENGTWYLENGKVTFGYYGVYTENNIRYTISCSRVIAEEVIDK